MKYRNLGNTKLRVSVVGIGTWQYGGGWGKTFGPTDVSAILGRGAELGLNFIDTAECYGNHLAESLIGQAIVGTRAEWIIATKFGHMFDADNKPHYAWSHSEVLAQLEDSLRALQTDYLDLYQIHSPPDTVFNDDGLWALLNRQVQAGKVRHLGISLETRNPSLHQVQRATQVGVKAIQLLYNRLDTDAETLFFPTCTEQGLGIVARVPLASGLLSGKYRAGAVFAPNDVRSGMAPPVLYERIKAVEAIRATELPPGVPLSEWAIAWCLKHPAVSCTIPGFKDTHQLEAGARAAELLDDGA